jgi:hypothetical protein
MEISTYTFSGDAVTFLGLVGLASTFLIIITAFRRFFNSPYNLRIKTTNVNESPEVYVDEND